MTETGELLAGRYRVLAPLGEGGAGSMFRALDLVSSEEVALKIARPGGAEESLERELELLGRLAHPRLPAVLDFGRAAGRAYYAAELVRGPSLAQRPLADWRALEPVIVDVLDALAFLHRIGVRHGDVKPDNILVAGGRGVLIDLGCAAPLGSIATELSGTLAFLAPELLEPAACADGRADLYALGRTLERCAEHAGRPPERWAALMRRMTAPRAERPDASEALELAGAADRALAPLPPEASRLLGRDAIVERFVAALDDRIARRPSVAALLLSGEPGSGRTRVLGELKRIAQRRVDVVEASARQRAPIASLLARSGDGEIDGAITVERALDGLARARQREHPLVWVIDDADRLEPADRRAFEAMVRALAPDDPILVLAVGALKAPAAEIVHVGPLDRAALAAWAAGRIDGREVDELLRLSGGHAATVRWLLGEAVRGTPADELARLASRSEHDLRASIERLPPTSRRVVWLLAALETEIDARALDALFIEVFGEAPDHADALARGWVRSSGGELRLSRPADAASILATLEPAPRRALHGALASWRHARGQDALAIRHAVLADRRELALELARAAHTEGSSWRLAADALAASDDPQLRLAGAHILERVGASAQAAEVLAGLCGAPETDEGLVRRRLGACLLKLERTGEALEQLARAMQLASSGDARASVTDVMSRAHIKRGEYLEAIERAREGMASGRDPSVVAALHEDLGVAMSYRGEAEAEAHLREAERLLEAHGGARERVRVASYLAIDAYRRGRLEAAQQGYERALQIAEDDRLEDQIAHAALNLGTVHHQRGELGAALAAYQRGHRMASALGQHATLATLELDYAQLFADCGAWDRARAAEERAREQARRGGFALIEGACAAVRAEIALGTARYDEAAAPIEEARAMFEASGAEREVAEARMLEARLALARGDETGAARALGMLGPALAGDLAVRRDLILGRMARDPEQARPLFERAAEAAERLGYGALLAEAHAELARAWTALSAHTVADSHRRRATELGERAAAGLPSPLRDSFWSHPARADLRAAPAASAGDRERRLMQLLAINRKLSSTLAVGDVLHQAMDAAIELTGAERGFLVLRDEEGGALSVAVARNLDRERVGRSHLKFSRTIAERAIETGEAVVTVDARADARFASNASVHAMKLRSVIAVPIPSPDGIVGAMYLDNRFSRGRFSEVDTDLLMAFADQVAIALANARRTEELARRTEELERERARVEALSAGQAGEIERLSAALVDKQHALERRYDYGALVAHSPAMQPILAVLEKVIDSPLTILVQGESGTGKELVARAVHFNGARKEGPFVTVNCAALPDALLESELFGHVRGAFTGAERDRDGLMVAAQGGTLFLDEIGETSLAMQAKLLRAIEQREVRPVGGTRSIAVDFRLVCATNRALGDEARAGRFREDLYYRIGVVEVRLPPLRERLEDLPELARRILARAAEELDRPAPSLSGEAMKRLLSQRWPGNVRQLQNVLRAAMVMAEGRVLEPRHLTLSAVAPPPRPAHSRAERDAREKARILEALEATDWNATLAAERAGISRATLYRKLAKHGIEVRRS